MMIMIAEPSSIASLREVVIVAIFAPMAKISCNHRDTDTVEGEDSDGIVSEFNATLDPTDGVHHADGSEGGHGVGDIVDTV